MQMNADQLFNAGLKCARAGDHRSAIFSLRLAASLEAGSAELHRLAGKVCVHLGDLKQAEDCFLAAVALDRGDRGAALCLATLRRCRNLRRAALTAGVAAAVLVMSLAVWSVWRAYNRLDVAIAALSAPAAQRISTPPAPEVQVPATPQATVIPKAPQKPPAAAAAKPSPATVPSSRVSPATPPASAPPQPAAAAPSKAPATATAFENDYRVAVGVAFKGDLKRALELLKPLSSEEYADNPLAGNVQFWMGRCLYELGRHEEALDHFQRVLDHYPKNPKRVEAIIDASRCKEKLKQKAAKP